MKTAGVVFDFYDDSTGELLKKNFPTLESLPETVKTAHILSSEERDILRDEAYALVMVNEGKTLRKFACVDAGNTLLSAMYFLENKDALPEEAQKTASANILAACEEFGLPVRDIEKIAARNLTKTRDAMKSPVVGDSADWAARTNLTGIKGSGADSGKVLSTVEQMKTAGDDAVGNDAQQIDFLNSHHKLNPKSKPKRHVDVSDKKPPMKAKKASAQHLALGRYPLDTYADVKTAIKYFSENYMEMAPADRHEYAVKTAARANELKLKTTDILDRYGSEEYAPDLEGHLASRRLLAPEYTEVWDALQEKRAGVSPDEFVKLLSQADESSGMVWQYGGQISDAYFATYGGNKVKEANELWSWKSPSGEHVSANQLNKLALNGRPMVKKQFDADLAEAFAANPIPIFESLPDTHKIILSRLANQEFDGLANN